MFSTLRIQDLQIEANRMLNEAIQSNDEKASQKLMNAYFRVLDQIRECDAKRYNIKKLVKLAKQCEEIAIKNQLVNGVITYFMNDAVKVGIYCNEDYKSIGIYFDDLHDWRKRIDVSLYSEDIKFSYNLTTKEINERIVLVESFIKQNLGL